MRKYFAKLWKKTLIFTYVHILFLFSDLRDNGHIDQKHKNTADKLGVVHFRKIHSDMVS